MQAYQSIRLLRSSVSGIQSPVFDIPMDLYNEYADFYLVMKNCYLPSVSGFPSPVSVKSKE